MAVGLGSTFEEVIKKINSCGDVTAAGNNTFTGTNTFNSTLICPGGVMSPIIYPGGENALTVPKKDGTLATIEDLTAQFGALNIQNGSGVKSIQQGADPKYNGVIKAASKNPYAKVLYPELTDAEPLGAIGDYAASFGGNSSVQAKRGIGGGTSSVTKGAYSQSLGDNTVTTPKASDSTAIGYQTTTDAPGAFTHGSFTVVMSQKYIEGMFDPSTKPGQGGSGQPTEPGTTPTDTLEMDSRRGEAASAGGFNSYSSGFAAEVDGVSNVADGHISKSSGRSNRSWSYLSKTDGKNSVVKPDPTNTDATGEGSWANGDNIQIIGAKYAYSGGNNNIVFAGADNSFSYGEGLQVKHKNQVVIGQYNDSNNNDLFVFGIGTGNSDRKNALRVSKEGKFYYGDFEVSNLKTTNDAVASLDNKLSPKINSNINEITKLWSTLRDTNTNLNRLNETKQATLVSGTNIKTINGQSILGEGDLEISGGGGSGGSNGGAYAHLVSFGFYRTDDSDIAGWGSIMIPSASAAAIVGTSVDNLKTFLAKFNGKFYPMAIKTDGYTTTPYTGIFVNPTNNSLNVVASASSGGNAEFTIDVYDITETVVQTSTGCGGGSGSNAPVLISVASTNSYRTDPQAQLSEHNIRVRVISGTLQAGDRLEICRPIAKKSYNLVNGVKKNVRWKQKLKACAHKILTETDIANIAAGKNILVLTVNHSTDQPNKGLKYTCTSNYSTFRGSAPRVIRIVRRTELLNSTQNIQISNSVYVTRSYGSNVIKGM